MFVLIFPLIYSFVSNRTLLLSTDLVREPGIHPLGWFRGCGMSCLALQVLGHGVN
jgi:hypothetical protein